MKTIEVGNSGDKKFKPVKLIMIIENRAEFSNLLGRMSLSDDVVAQLVPAGVTPRFRSTAASTQLYETLHAIGARSDFWRNSAAVETLDEWE